MSKLKSLVADAIKSMKTEIDSAAGVIAAAPEVEAPKAKVVSKSALGAMPKEAQRAAELGYIIKSIRGGALTKSEASELDRRVKAVGVTTDIASLLPSGFTGTLWSDIQLKLGVTGMFGYKATSPGAYDSIATHGIEGFLVGEATDGTDSAEGYITMIYLVKKCMAIVRKSYEALDDSLIDLATEVRNGIVDAIARSIENAVINGDNTAVHFDDNANIAAGDFRRAFKGLRKLGLNKTTVDFGGAALTEANWLTYISAMQEAGGVYLSEEEVAMGNVALIVDQNAYNQIRMFPSFLTKEKSGMGTLFGADVASIFGIPVIMTPYMPKTTALGVVSPTPALNIVSACVLVNKSTCVYYSTGTPTMEQDRNIVNQSIINTGSVRVGFNSKFDRLDTDPTAIDATRGNIVYGININRI